CGFRSADEVRAIVGALGDIESGPLHAFLRRVDSGLRDTVGWLLSGGAEVRELVALVVRFAGSAEGWPLEFDTVATLAADYPADPGIVISLLLNRVRLRPGEALYLPAGNIHAYLNGLGVELMTASDNVLRGGLTPKHVDVPELLSVLDFRSVPVPYLRPSTLGPSVEVFRPDVPDFVLVRVTGDATWPLDGPAILICTAGGFTVNGTPCARGQSFYVTPGEGMLRFAGSGTLFVATTGA
ncbi:MAG: mannose-6-phosphate isomerase, class I, partial [Actinomycetota bacterium]